jgi:transcriptional regulator with XRE-family HTH domain
VDPVPTSADRFASKAMDTSGRHIRRARQNKRLTVRGLARHIGVAASFVADIEADRRWPSPGVLARIAQVLDVPFAVLQDLDPRLPPEVKEWLATSPGLVACSAGCERRQIRTRCSKSSRTSWGTRRAGGQAVVPKRREGRATHPLRGRSLVSGLRPAGRVGKRWRHHATVTLAAGAPSAPPRRVIVAWLATHPPRKGGDTHEFG